MNKIEVFAKDKVRINVLSALKNGLAEVTVYAESEGRDISYAELRPSGDAAFRYNNFIISETPEDDSIVFCPVVVGCLSIISISIAHPGAAVSLIRKGADTPEFSAGLDKEKTRVVLSPIDMKRYSMMFESGGGVQPRSSSAPAGAPLREQEDALLGENAALRGDIAVMERRIAELEAEKANLSDRREELRERVKWLLANSGHGELDDLKATLGVDEEILACYETPKEDVLRLRAEVKTGIEKLEEHIRIFIEKREASARKIEGQIKLGR
ncbi:MAG: hypothetical protein LBD04_04750 [Synergistaceae bacterium]|jgi:hypothetical protein|nr:hypothetical protein [Synergistaceae bacterium]